MRRQAFLEGRQVWCIYCFIGQAVPLSYRFGKKRVHVVVRIWARNFVRIWIYVPRSPLKWRHELLSVHGNQSFVPSFLAPIVPSMFFRSFVPLHLLFFFMICLVAVSSLLIYNWLIFLVYISATVYFRFMFLLFWIPINLSKARQIKVL